MDKAKKFSMKLSKLNNIINFKKKRENKTKSMDKKKENNFWSRDI